MTIVEFIRRYLPGVVVAPELTPALTAAKKVLLCEALFTERGTRGINKLPDDQAELFDNIAVMQPMGKVHFGAPEEQYEIEARARYQVAAECVKRIESGEKAFMEGWQAVRMHGRAEVQAHG